MRRLKFLPISGARGQPEANGPPRQQQTPLEAPAGIYIHIPFCERKCVYCNFNTRDFSAPLARRYVDAVALEISCLGEGLGRPLVDSIYFGGGTPSMLEADQVAALIEACRAAFRVSPDAEVTIEINPSDLSGGRPEGWISAGVNRASLGVQSFIDRELISLGRTHTADQARRALDALRRAGFENISLDLIAGLPAQSLSDWEFNLREALRLKPEHLSLYLLEVKEGTQLHALIERGLCPKPDDDLAAEMYQMICEATQGAGYEHYEISNFALSPLRRSRHNMKYWTGAPFYGAGCGAHSYDGRARWVNIARTESYIEAVCRTGRAVAEYRELTDEERAAEALFMGLRLIEGISLDRFRTEYGLDVMSRYGEELASFERAGLVEVTDGRLRLTRKGLLLSNEVFQAFV